MTVGLSSLSSFSRMSGSVFCANTGFFRGRPTFAHSLSNSSTAAISVFLSFSLPIMLSANNELIIIFAASNVAWGATYFTNAQYKARAAAGSPKSAVLRLNMRKPLLSS